LRGEGDEDVRALVDRLMGILDSLKSQYEAVLESAKIICSIASILDSKDECSGSEVRDKLLDFINSIKPKTKLAKRVLREILAYTNRWLQHLFYAYDDPRIPKTNNALETFIAKLKRFIRCLTGWRHSNDFCVRWGSFMAFTLKFKPSDIVAFLDNLPWGDASRHYKEYCKYLGEIGLSAYKRKIIRANYGSIILKN